MVTIKFYFIFLALILHLSSCFRNLGDLVNVGPGTKINPTNENNALASWKASLPIVFSSVNSFESGQPKAVFDELGHIVISWNQFDGANFQIFYSYFDGNTWHHPISLSDHISPSGQDAYSPQIATNIGGKIVITWTQSDGTNYQIFCSYFDGVTWNHPSSLNDNISPDGQNAFSPQVAMNVLGKILISWQQSDGSKGQIFYSYFNGASWVHPTSLSDNISPDGQDAFYSKIAMNNDGKILICWEQSDGFSYQIFYSYFDGVSWDHPSSLTDNISPDVQSAHAPQVAMNTNGKILITWEQSDGANLQIFYSYFDGISWDHPSNLSDNISPNGQAARSPQVAMNSNGKIVITWEQADGASEQIFYSYFNGASWDHPSNLNDNISPDGQFAFAPQVAMNVLGKILISWHQFDGSKNQIFYSYFDGAIWDHPSSLNDNISPDGQAAVSPQVSMDNDGKMVITWIQSDGEQNQIFYSYFNGLNWDHPSSLTDNISPDGQAAITPQVATNSDGKILISWQQFDGTKNQIFYSYFNGVSWDHPSSLEDNISPDGQDAIFPRVNMNSDGKMLISWQQSDGAKWQIFNSYFDGANWVHPSSLNDNISPDGQNAYFPQVAMNNDGKILISWQQYDGANFQIFYSYFNGASWDHPSSLNDNISPDGQVALTPQVAMNNDGKMLISWQQSDGAHFQIFYSYFDGVSWDHPSSLSDNISPDGQFAFSAQVAMNNSGEIVITWEQSDGASVQIFYSYFNGFSWDHPSNLNDNISPDGQTAKSPVVAMNNNGEIVITWEQSNGVKNQTFYSYFNGINWKHPSSINDYELPNGASECSGPIPLMTTNIKKIMMTCIYQGRNRIYELDSSSQFKAGNATDYLSLENESVLSLRGKIVSDTKGVLTYQSTINTPTISPIKYILWGLN